MWGVGCIFGELLCNEPILRGMSELDQLSQIWKLLGSPNEKIWPGFSELPNAKKISIHQPYSTLRHRFKNLSEQGFDLMNRMLTYDPKKRISARDAIQHPYFSERPLPKSPDMMPTFPIQWDEITKTDQGFKGKRKNMDDIVKEENREDKQFEQFHGELFENNKQQRIS